MASKGEIPCSKNSQHWLLRLRSVWVLWPAAARPAPPPDTGYSAENPLVLTLAHGLSETHTVHIAMTQFAEEVNERPMAASRSRSSPTASSAARTRTLSSCRQALSP